MENIALKICHVVCKQDVKQCCFNAGTTSKKLTQHLNNIGLHDALTVNRKVTGKWCLICGRGGGGGAGRYYLST